MAASTLKGASVVNAEGDDLGHIERDHAACGTRVNRRCRVVVWGFPGCRQEVVRCAVERTDSRCGCERVSFSMFRRSVWRLRRASTKTGGHPRPIHAGKVRSTPTTALGLTGNNEHAREARELRLRLASGGGELGLHPAPARVGHSPTELSGSRLYRFRRASNRVRCAREVRAGGNAG
jgi:hypothetical protein